jgi:hypothetical protein
MQKNATLSSVHEEFADVAVVAGVVVAVPARRNIAVPILVGPEGQDEPHLAAAIGQPLVGRRRIDGIGALGEDRGVRRRVVGAIDQRASFVQRRPEIGHAVLLAPAEAFVGGSIPDLVEIEREADLHRILERVVEDEGAGVAIADIVLAGFVVALPAENVDLRIVLGGGFLRGGLQWAGEIVQLPVDVGREEDVVGRVLRDFDPALEADLGFVGILRVVGEGRGTGEQKHAAASGRRHQAIEHGSTVALHGLRR